MENLQKFNLYQISFNDVKLTAVLKSER
jgi:hypothetical protein